jgi:hypothetical protein
MPPVSAVGRLPLATSGAYDPGRRIDARLLTFRARAADQAHAASTPDTTWPATRATARLIPRAQKPPGFDATYVFRRLNDDARPQTKPGPNALERLPDPHLTRSRRAFSLDARHDGLQPTQHQGGLTPTPAGSTPEDRGRDRRCRRPPARIPACASTHWAPPSGSGVKAQVRPGMKDPGLG